MDEQVTDQFGCQDSRADTSETPGTPNFARDPDLRQAEIVARINTRAFTTAANAPSPPLTAEGLRESLREFARQLDLDRRIAGRLEAGALVRQHLASIAAKTPPRPAWMPPPTVTGLPIVANDNLQPDEWRLLDTDGGVMSEGRISHLNQP